MNSAPVGHTKKRTKVGTKNSGSTKRARNRSDPSPSKRMTRSDGSAVRRLTIYLPEALARRLAMYAAVHDTNMSTVVARVLAEGLRR